MTSEELSEMYFYLFGEEPPVLTTVSTENEDYKKMLAYCNLNETPVTDEIVKMFFEQYDLIQEENSFSHFKKEN